MVNTLSASSVSVRYASDAPAMAAIAMTATRPMLRSFFFMLYNLFLS